MEENKDIVPFYYPYQSHGDSSYDAETLLDIISKAAD
jgi:hypothetical protein